MKQQQIGFPAPLDEADPSLGAGDAARREGDARLPPNCHMTPDPRRARWNPSALMRCIQVLLGCDHW